MDKLFGKKSDDSGKPAEKKARKQKNPKKSKRGRKDTSLVGLMQLDETVAASSLDVLDDLVRTEESAIREVEEGFLIVVLTNEMLDASGIDRKSEDFGSLAEGLRTETIESITLASDLERGVIGLLLSRDTLASLDEYDFIHDTEFKWALVPIDLDDEGEVEILESTAHIEDLIELAEDQSITLSINDNGGVTRSDGGAIDQVAVEPVIEETYVPEPEVNQEDDFINEFDEDVALDEPEPELELELEPEQEPVDDVDTSFDDSSDYGNEFDVSDDFDLGEDDDLFDTPEDDSGLYDPSEDVIDEFDDDNSLFDDSDSEFDVDYTPEEEVTPEESKALVNKVATQSFNDTSLDLILDIESFDNQFDAIDIVRFDTTVVEDNELQRVLAEKKRNANTEIKRFSQDGIQTLRNLYISSLRDIKDKLGKSFDYKSDDTYYGENYREIEDSYSKGLREIDRNVSARVKKERDSYNEERDAYAEIAKQEALGVYDTRYRPEHIRKLDIIPDDIKTELKTERDVEFGELLKDRRDVAQRLYDSSKSELLQKIQREYAKISDMEIKMYDDFRKGMDTYLRSHFSDEVLRAKASAESLKQSHEADSVRRELSQTIDTRTQQLDDLNEKNRIKLKQVYNEHEDEINRIKNEISTDYTKDLKSRDKEIESLRGLLQESNENMTKIGAEKEAELQHRLKTQDDEIKARKSETDYFKEQLAYTEKRASKSQLPSIFVSLAIGLIFGIGMLIGGYLLAHTGDIPVDVVPEKQEIAPGSDFNQNEEPAGQNQSNIQNPNYEQEQDNDNVTFNSPVGQSDLELGGDVLLFAPTISLDSDNVLDFNTFDVSKLFEPEKVI